MMSPVRRDAMRTHSSWAQGLYRSLLVAAILLLAACASAPRRNATTDTAASGRTWPQPASPQEANDVLIHAIGLVGTPYHWGGNTPNSGFDCSGLVDYVFRTTANVRLPRTSHAMSRLNAPKILQRGHLASGDLLFFRTEGHRISHVAIYVGNGRFVHAPNTGGTVELSNLSNPYWSKHFAYGRRVLD